MLQILLEHPHPGQYQQKHLWIRFSFHLKKVKNKACIEALIFNAHISEEALTFASYYFEPHMESKRKTVGRNDKEAIDPNITSFSVFNLGRSSGTGSCRYLSDEEMHAAQMYGLMNCLEVEPYIQ
ncbi:hypothetical protein ACH5RR_036977 [Cinchona calisaya]|uniref:DUF4218 domain-containing protein n=1 Tax=Cinchona calisaya TaxID=153742 RepID=A0ABD2Y4V3_9GENT